MADYVIVFPYWGDEYTFTTGATEKEWAKKMTEAGADLIIGSHTHYIGEVEEITTDNGNKSLCYYSLGNFCSTFNNPSTMVGAMAKVNIVFDGEEVYIDKEGTGLIPIVTHYTHSGNADDEAATVVGVYPLSKYTSAMAASHGIKTRGKVAFSLEFVTSLVDEHVDDKYLLEE
jgi:poly-gamma-glutamate synthesis protein (capsule biosynthesis protein)